MGNHQCLGYKKQEPDYFDQKSPRSRRTDSKTTQSSANSYSTAHSQETSSHEKQKEKVVPSRTTDRDRGILQMKVQRDKLLKHRKKLEGMIVLDLDTAKKYLTEVNKNLNKAKFALTKKKHHEKLVEQIDNSVAVILKLIDDVEFASVQETFVKAMKTGNDVLKEIQAEMSVDSVSEVLEEAQDLQVFLRISPPPF